MDEVAQAFEVNRARVFGVAYRMLGSAALELSESAVKTNLHRARRAIDSRGPIREVDTDAVEVLMKHLAARDHEAVRAMLDESIETFADGGDSFFAAPPQKGVESVMRLLIGLSSKYTELSFSTLELNGQLMVLGVRQKPRPVGLRAFVWLPNFRAGGLSNSAT